jgi:two-component system, sensor histidine kinase and response regulator
VLEKTKILAVDDFEDNLASLGDCMDRPDLDLLTARSGTEAIALLAGHDVALALVDVQMPHMDGFELAEAMRADPRLSHIPIIFLTAMSRDQTRMFHGYESGAVDFLYKPVECQILRSKIDTFVQLHQQRVQLAAQIEVLRETIRLNEALVAILGHDLRGPLGSVLSSIEGFFDKPDPESTERIAVGMRSTIQRMTRMIDQLLEFARLRHGAIELRPVPTNMAGLLARILREDVETRPEGDIQLETVGDTGGHWDPDRLMQALASLIDNARRHRAAGTPIRVRLDGTDAARVVVQVENAGTISPELLPHLFEPFHSSRDQRGSPSEGRGLGLYVVKQMVDAHGGSVSVRSEPGEGTRVDVVVPRGVAPALADPDEIDPTKG